MSCTLCEVRKEKRFCLAVHGRICPQCCGEAREVTLDCPSDCVYLQQSRQFERPRSIHDLDQSGLFPEIAIPQQFVYDREPLIGALSFALAKVGRQDRALHDRDLIAALTAVAKTYQTLVSSGLVYEAAAPLAQQHAVIDELQKMIAGFRESEQKHLGYHTLKDGEALQALVFLLRLAATRTSGRPRSRAFLDFLTEQFPEKESSLLAAPEPSAGRIIMP